MMEIFKVFTFEAAHFLPFVPPEHKCRRLHGHTFRIEVHVAGPVGAESGWVMDYAQISQSFGPLLQQLDHHFLNAIAGLDNPTSENLAHWIWSHLKPNLPELYKIVVQENCMSGCVFRG